MHVDTSIKQDRSKVRWLVVLFVVARQYQRRRRARLDYVDAGGDALMDFIDPGIDKLEANPLVDVVHDCEYAVSWLRFSQGPFSRKGGPPCLTGVPTGIPARLFPQPAL